MSQTTLLTRPVTCLARDNVTFLKMPQSGSGPQIVPDPFREYGEVREGHDHLPRFVAGNVRAKIGMTTGPVGADDAVVVPSNDDRNLRRTAVGVLKPHTTCGPPERDQVTKRDTKSNAPAEGWSRRGGGCGCGTFAGPKPNLARAICNRIVPPNVGGRSV